MKTLLLDRSAWDLVLDASGNIALAAEPYSLAQDAASAVKTFLGECWYDNTVGLPHFSEVLGHWPPAALIKSLVERQALTVPGVTSADCTITSLDGRTVSGRVLINGSEIISF